MLFSFALVTLAFAVTAAWSVGAQRDAARDADLMRRGYLPLALAFRDAVALQDSWNSQLNHITDARNPADKRVWFDVTMKVGRSKAFGDVRTRLAQAFAGHADPDARSSSMDVSTEVTSIERFLEGDRELLSALFDALDRGDAAGAKKARDELVLRGNQGKQRLSALEARVSARVDALLEEAKARERLAFRLLVALSLGGVLVGAFMALYARRVLRPLAAVTARAQSVALGDLTPRPVVSSNDEIGELAETFEGMVSAIARANDELLASERLATIGKMAAHVTHEIRNPLSSIALNVELLEDELPDDGDEARALTRAIKAEVDRLTALSAEYLSVARRQPPRLVEEDVAEVVKEAIDFMRADLARHGTSVSFEADADLDPCPIDEAQVKQALFNLLRNAREAMPAGGHVRVSVARAPGGSVRVTVDDEGSGMADEARQRLFEPFFTTKGHGTGLGLAITRQIVEAHLGRIECLPRVPQGTRFVLEFPSREEPSGTTDSGRAGS